MWEHNVLIISLFYLLEAMGELLIITIWIWAMLSKLKLAHSLTLGEVVCKIFVGMNKFKIDLKNFPLAEYLLFSMLWNKKAGMVSALETLLTGPLTCRSHRLSPVHPKPLPSVFDHTITLSLTTALPFVNYLAKGIGFRFLNWWVVEKEGLPVLQNPRESSKG